MKAGRKERKGKGTRKKNERVSSYVSDFQLISGVQEISHLNLFLVNLMWKN